MLLPAAGKPTFLWLEEPRDFLGTALRVFPYWLLKGEGLTSTRLC